MKAFDEELVSGSIVRSVWKLSWPIVGMNLINGARGLIDQILIAHFVQHHEANAAVGVAWNLFLVIVVSLASLFQGMGVLIAQSAGKQDRAQMNNVLYHTFLLTVYLVIFIIAPVGYLLSPQLLELVNTTPEVHAYALPYLRVLFLFTITLAMNYLMSTALQTSGDAKTPLVLVVLTTVLHCTFSAVFITGIGPFPEMGTTGAALGAALAPVPTVLITLYLIVRRRMVLGLPDKFTLLPDWNVIRAVARIGVPSGVHAVVLNIGGLWLLRYVGSLPESSAAQAAYTICYTQLFSFVTWAALGLRGAAATLMGQNIGAGKSERGRRCVHVAAVIGVICAVTWGIAAWLGSDQMLYLFHSSDKEDAVVAAFGTSLLHYLSFSGVFLAVALAMTGGLMGAGDTKKPMYIAIVSQIFILLGVCEIYDQLGLLTANAIWSAIFIGHFSRYVLTHVAFRTAKLKPLVVELGH